MWWMAASAGLNLLGAANSYAADKAQSKAQRAWQAYTNKMVDLSATVSQNAITTNELLAHDAFANQAFQLRKDTILTRAKVEASAAGAGVKGRSVNLAMRQVLGNAASREAERQENFRVTELGFDQQRMQVAMSAAMQKDYSYIPKPNAASYFLSAAANTFSSTGGFGYAK
jgi:hypothetical protein